MKSDVWVIHPDGHCHDPFVFPIPFRVMETLCGFLGQLQAVRLLPLQADFDAGVRRFLGALTGGPNGQLGAEWKGAGERTGVNVGVK